MGFLEMEMRDKESTDIVFRIGDVMDAITAIIAIIAMAVIISYFIMMPAFSITHRQVLCY